EQESAGYEYAGKNFPNRTFIGFYSAGKKQQAIKQEHHAGQYSRLRALIAPDQAYIIFEKSTQTAKAIEPGILFRTTSFNHICQACIQIYIPGKESSTQPVQYHQKQYGHQRPVYLLVH